MADLSHLEGHWVGVLDYEFDIEIVGDHVVVTSSVDGQQRNYAISEVQTFVAKRIWMRAGDRKPRVW